MSAKADRYLCFDLGTEQFAMPLLMVREVVALPEITIIPQMPSHFLGIINLRGSVISVMDLRVRMGIEKKLNEETAVVILDLGDLQLGVVVDRVSSVANLQEDEILAKPHLENGRANDSITGVWQKENKLILLINVAKALSLEDKALAADAARKAA